MTFRWLAALPLIGALALTGCVTIRPQADAFTPRAECERNGGCWHSHTEFCEPKAP
jgi:hypothetical protein